MGALKHVGIHRDHGACRECLFIENERAAGKLVNPLHPLKGFTVRPGDLRIVRVLCCR